MMADDDPDTSHATPETGELLCASAEFDGERRAVEAHDEFVLTRHLPLQGEPRGRALLIPGWSGTRSGPADLLCAAASALARAGWEAVRIDLPGRGDANGELHDSGLDEMIWAVFHALQLDGTPRPTVLIGLCSGGNVALGTAALGPHAARWAGAESLATLPVLAVSLLPYQRSRSSAFDRRRRWRNLKQYALKALSLRIWLRLLKGEVNVARVSQNLSATDAAPAAAVAPSPATPARNLKDSARDIEAELLQWRGPGRFLWGGGDDEAPPARAHFEKLLADGAGRGVTCHTLPGVNHNFYGRDAREALIAELLAFVAGIR